MRVVNSVPLIPSRPILLCQRLVIRLDEGCIKLASHQGNLTTLIPNGTELL